MKIEISSSVEVPPVCMHQSVSFELWIKTTEIFEWYNPPLSECAYIFKTKQPAINSGLARFRKSVRRRGSRLLSGLITPQRSSPYSCLKNRIKQEGVNHSFHWNPSPMRYRSSMSTNSICDLEAHRPLSRSRDSFVWWGQRTTLWTTPDHQSEIRGCVCDQ